MQRGTRGGARSSGRRMTVRGRLSLAALTALVASGVWGALPERTEEPGAPPVFPVAGASLPIPLVKSFADVGAGRAREGGATDGGETAREPAGLGPAAAAPVPQWQDDWLAPPVSRSAHEALHLERGRYQREVADGTRTVRVRYTLDPDLTQSVWRVLRKGRIALGHVVVMDARTGALYVYASTDPERFPPQAVYPAASLVKVVTAAAALDESPSIAKEICRYRGNPYRLRRSHLKAPRSGREASLQRALATSNNQCFARWAVDRVGSEGMLAALDRFGLLRSPAAGHTRGTAQVPDGPLELGRLGSGLDGLRITPLHAVQLAAVLADGQRVEPYWIEQGTLHGVAGSRVLPLPRARAERVVPPEMAQQLRTMLVDTTKRGTARRAFRTRQGRPLLQGITVAGKTGSLNGTDPDGRYEWFIGVAPAEDPRIAVATLAVQGDLYWMSASQLAAEVLKAALCPKGVCRAEALDRLGRPEIRTAAR